MFFYCNLCDSCCGWDFFPTTFEYIYVYYRNTSRSHTTTDNDEMNFSQVFTQNVECL